MKQWSETRGMLLVAALALAVGVGSYAVIRMDPWAEEGSGLPATFQLDVGALMRVDAELVRFEEVAQFAVPLNRAAAIAVGPPKQLLVAGDRTIVVLDLTDGQVLRQIPLDGQPTCLAFAAGSEEAPARIYAGVDRRMLVFSPEGEPLGKWQLPEDEAVLTSIAAAGSDVFVADAGSRVVLRLDQEGQVVGRIGQPDPERQMPGFVVPSPYFDLAMGQDGLLYVANPGKLRIEAFSRDGQLETFWGQAGNGIADFFGCCNPVHFAVAPDGGFVTSEKGIPRIKYYDQHGELGCVVAGPQQLGVSASQVGDPRLVQGGLVFDVAVARDGRVLVLDPRGPRVRVFARKENLEKK